MKLGASVAVVSAAFSAFPSHSHSFTRIQRCCICGGCLRVSSFGLRISFFHCRVSLYFALFEEVGVWRVLFGLLIFVVHLQSLF